MIVSWIIEVLVDSGDRTFADSVLEMPPFLFRGSR